MSANNNIDRYITNDDVVVSDSAAFDMSKDFKEREAEISSFLKNMLYLFYRRSERKMKAQKSITIVLMILICLSFFVLGFVLICPIFYKVDETVILTSAISSIVSFVGSTVSLLLIIVKYIFPKNEDENNFKILESIMHKDFEYANMDKTKIDKEIIV